MNRGVRNAQSDQLSNSPSPAATDKKAGKMGRGGLGKGNLGKAGSMGFLLLIVILFVLALFSLVMFKGNEGEQKLVDKSKFQAVFLNGGQVYFGKIGDLNGKYMSVKDIYYLRVNQQVQPNANTSSSNDISLVKLGCELHGPQDQMVINREQVIFWENLKTDGQVAKAIDEYRKQYPDGQKCEDQQSQQNSGAQGSTQESTTTPAANTSTTTPTTTTTPATNNTRR